MAEGGGLMLCPAEIAEIAEIMMSDVRWLKAVISHFRPVKAYNNHIFSNL
jgi:hypothetical protein